MKRFWSLLAAALLIAAVAATAQGGALKIYCIDVEGGQATLFVTPEQKSLLIDTGWPGNGGRDADRIVAAARSAGLSRIDYVLITHYHDDHVGGVAQLAARIPIGTFIDHGPNREENEPVTARGYAAYTMLLHQADYGHIVAKPGDRLPVPGFDVRVVSGDGALIQKPLPGAGQANPYCAESEKRPADKTENARSLGTLLRFGKLVILDLGDLTWDKEMELMCPMNRLGHVDLLLVSHHGWYQSSSPALVNAIRPRVAIMDNGAKKGGSPKTMDTIRSAPGIAALWQLHYSDEGGAEHNTATRRIANPQGTDHGYGLVVTATRDGYIKVYNPRTHQAEGYRP